MFGRRFFEQISSPPPAQVSGGGQTADIEPIPRSHRIITAITIAITLVGALAAVYMAMTPAGRAFPWDQGNSTTQGVVKAGQHAPAFHLARLGGSPATLTDFAGHPTLINVWATWCIPCRQEMPAIQRVYDREHPQGLDALAINMFEKPDDVAAFVGKLQFAVPVAIDDGSFQQRYGVIVVPTSFFIDAQGIVRRVQVGAMNDATLEQDVNALLQR